MRIIQNLENLLWPYGIDNIINDALYVAQLLKTTIYVLHKDAVAPA